MVPYFRLSLTSLLSPQIPAELYDAVLKNLVQTDPDAVDQLLKRKCIEQGWVGEDVTVLAASL